MVRGQSTPEGCETHYRGTSEDDAAAWRPQPSVWQAHAIVAPALSRMADPLPVDLSRIVKRCESVRPDRTHSTGDS